MTRTAPRPRPGLTLPILACLTLGLAPYFPLPHALEKLHWIYGGHAFRPVDVFDLLLHWAPWAWLGWTLAHRAKRR
jgi:hypothetical protein